MKEYVHIARKILNPRRLSVNIASQIYFPLLNLNATVTKKQILAMNFRPSAGQKMLALLDVFMRAVMLRGAVMLAIVLPWAVIGGTVL
tara:strand:- start:80 stop:343 length:264 start_codon:yes stop_codon:yes gene_type:complete